MGVFLKVYRGLVVHLSKSSEQTVVKLCLVISSTFMKLFHHISLCGSGASDVTALDSPLGLSQDL